ncbi:MAG: hypothetical protein K2Y32_04755 [Candidatus Obscuribacterales bacterium]|nr:hypothetical protein [Candidatus Obscuribacterales bacterium]
MNASFNQKNLESSVKAKEDKAILAVKESNASKGSQDNQSGRGKPFSEEERLGHCSDGVCSLIWKPRAPKKAS